MTHIKENQVHNNKVNRVNKVNLHRYRIPSKRQKIAGAAISAAPK